MKLYSDKISNEDLCQWIGLPVSVFYYKPREGKRGAKPSIHTMKADGTQISNELVVDEIRGLLKREFCCYGYHLITDDLRDLSYKINDKKVYRLMDENNLLLGKVITTRGKREFVKHRKIQANYPMEVICLDIKYVWVHGEKRNYYLLTILDVFSRKAIEQIFQSSIRKMDVINLFRKIDRTYGIKGVTIRNDNGSQFIANDVKNFMKSAEAKQEFTHIATPQENSYIEAFHSIVQREVVDRFEFDSYYDAKKVFEKHLLWYNNERKHGMLGKISPQRKWDNYYQEKLNEKVTFAMSDKAEAGNAGEQPARNNLTDDDEKEELQIACGSSSSFHSSLSLIPEKNSGTKESTNLNSFEKCLQEIGG